MFVRGTFSFLSGELYRKIWFQDCVARILQNFALKDVKLLQTHSLSQVSFPVGGNWDSNDFSFAVCTWVFLSSLTYSVCG